MIGFVILQVATNQLCVLFSSVTRKHYPSTLARCDECSSTAAMLFCLCIVDRVVRTNMNFLLQVSLTTPEPKPVPAQAQIWTVPQVGIQTADNERDSAVPAHCITHKPHRPQTNDTLIWEWGNKILHMGSTSFYGDHCREEWGEGNHLPHCQEKARYITWNNPSV